VVGLVEKHQDEVQKDKKLEVTQKCDQHSVISLKNFQNYVDMEKIDHEERMLNQNLQYKYFTTSPVLHCKSRNIGYCWIDFLLDLQKME
jgi:hypothetical protein